MKLLTFWNIAGLGLGVFGVAMIVDALPNSGSSALAQSTIVTSVSDALENIAPNPLTPTSQSLSNLLRVGERTYQVSFDSAVSSQVLSKDTVRKIAFGNDTTVSVVTTPTGTYSTDGLASPHVQYPGVSVVESSQNLNNFDIKLLNDGKFVDLSAFSPQFSGS